MVKNKLNMNVLLIVGVVVLVVFGARAGWFDNIGGSSTIVDTTLIERLDTGNDGGGGGDELCVLEFSDSVYTVGETVTGDLRDGANTLCNVYINFNDGGWNLLGSVVTDSAGFASESTVAGQVGSYAVRAVCGGCLTNKEAFVIVADGGNGGNGDGAVCDDTDDGIDIYEGGTCTDVINILHDDCIGGALSEVYCDGDVCAVTMDECPTGYTCVDDECVKPQCGAIMFPSGQGMCTGGVCPEGEGCQYIAAQQAMPAYCDCMPN